MKVTGRVLSEQARWSHCRAPTFVFLSILTTISVCGCTKLHQWKDNGFKVGPEYFKPAASVSTDWIDSYDERISTDLPNDSSWWDTFGDPVLADLVQNAFNQNLTLRAAGMRVQQARTIRAIAAGNLLPQQQQAFGNYSKSMLSRNTFPGNISGHVPRSVGYWSGGFDAFWEIDVWGRFRRNIESADASLDASIESHDDILIILVADVAATYVEIRTLQQQLAYKQSNIELQKISLEIADAQHKGGRVSELDPLQAETDLKNTEQTVLPLEAQLRDANLQLCTLLGIPPRDLTTELGQASIPVAPANVAIGVPANLLRRRPDVRQAERLVAAQSAQIGVAVADLYPHFSISGNIRIEATQFNNLWNSASGAGSIGPAFNWDILNYGRLQNNVLLQDAQFQELAINYQQTVLQANQEIESAVNNFLKAQERLQDLNDLIATVEKAVKIGVARYRVGATDFIRVSNLQLRLVQAQDSAAITEGDVAQSLIAIYRALGGGWQMRLGSAAPVAQVKLPILPVEEVAPDGSGAGKPKTDGAPIEQPAPAVPAPPKAPPESAAAQTIRSEDLFSSFRISQS